MKTDLPMFLSEKSLCLELVGGPQSLTHGPLHPQSANVDDFAFDDPSVALVDSPTQSANTPEKPQPRQRKRQDATSDYVVRDTFSMPTKDYGVIEVIRLRLAREGYICSKSEVIRAGLLALNSMRSMELIEKISVVEKIKMGRKT